jgi:hypothetical protein
MPHNFKIKKVNSYYYSLLYKKDLIPHLLTKILTGGSIISINFLSTAKAASLSLGKSPPRRAGSLLGTA